MLSSMGCGMSTLLGRAVVRERSAGDQAQVAKLVIAAVGEVTEPPTELSYR